MSPENQWLKDGFHHLFKWSLFPKHVNFLGLTTVDGSEILHHLACVFQPLLTNGMFTTNLNWWMPDFSHQQYSLRIGKNHHVTFRC